MNTLLKDNFAILKQFHPDTLTVLDVLTPSAEFRLKGTEQQPLLGFSTQTWELSEAFLPPSGVNWGYVVYGLGTGEYLKRLLAHKLPEVPILVIDSMPELALFCLQNFDYQAILSHPSLTYLVDHPTRLSRPLHSYLSGKRDLLQVQWLSNPWVSQLASDRQDAFYFEVFQQYQAYIAQAPTQAKQALALLYQKMEAPMQKAYATYPLSCPSGCADCCKMGNGFDLCIRPLEWEMMFEALSQGFPPQEQNRLIAEIVLYLAKNVDYIKKTLFFFDENLDQLQTEKGNQAFYKVTQVLRQDPCPFLTKAETCGIYTHRPLSCRAFGNSVFSPSQPYTCGKDQPVMKLILADEKSPHCLLDGGTHLSELQTLHSHYTYGHVIYVWLFTHLDFESENWIEAVRLDYHQFKSLVDDPELLQAQFQALQTWAQKLENADP